MKVEIARQEHVCHVCSKEIEKGKKVLAVVLKDKKPIYSHTVRYHKMCAVRYLNQLIDELYKEEVKTEQQIVYESGRW